MTVINVQALRLCLKLQTEATERLCQLFLALGCFNNKIIGLQDTPITTVEDIGDHLYHNVQDIKEYILKCSSEKQRSSKKGNTMQNFVLKSLSIKKEKIV